MSVFLKRQTVRRRRRWGERLRQIERALLSVLIVVIGLAALYGLYRVVFLGSAFELERIVVEGDWKYLSPDEVASLSGVRKGDNLFWMSVDDVYGKLDGNPWVKEAAVRRRLPDTLQIYVEEYRPVAIVLSRGFHYVDGESNIVKQLAPYDDRDMPIITGIEFGEGLGPDDESLARLGRALNIIDVLSSSRFGREYGVAEVHFDEVDGYSFMTRREPMQALLGHSNFAERVSKIDRMRRAIAARQGRIQYMLADEDGRIIVKYRPT